MDSPTVGTLEAAIDDLSRQLSSTMEYDELDLPDLVKKASARAVAPTQFLSLVKSWLSARELSDQQSQNVLASALLSRLAAPYPPANIFNYISQSLSTSALSARTLAIHLLFASYDSLSLSDNAVVSVAGMIMANLTDLQPGQRLLSSLERSTPPDVGSSSGVSQPVPTLSLLLPLLRQCTSPGVSLTIVGLVDRLLALLDSHPAPPLDVGLEAGSLLQLLPEQLAVRLRQCLSGLMADLSDQKQQPMDQIVENGVPSAQIAAPTGSQSDLPTPLLHSGPLAIPLPKMINFLLVHAVLASTWTPSTDFTSIPPRPPENHIALIRIGSRIASDPSTFLLHLIQGCVTFHTGEYIVNTYRGAVRWLFMTEHLPALLRWWKDQNMPEWPFPDNLAIALSTVLEMETSPIEQKNGYISGMMDMLASAADNDDEAGSFNRPDGWMLCTEQITLVQRFAEYGLLDNQQIASLLPNMSIPPATVGESLMYRVASAPRSHLPALAHVIGYAPGAARSFAVEVLRCICLVPATPPPDGLFVNLASDPNILATLCGYVNPATILDLVKRHLMDLPDDASTRSEDPQGAMTRFGEGVVFAEAIIAVAELPLPELLLEARRSHNLAAMSDKQRSCVNGWVKALFGPDGIDDQILLATSPPDFYRLAPTLIQQAILATAAGQIDLATLHSGLSYFSQSLLSWSLGGVAAWLCSEIVRNGHLSGLHLNVLQNLVTSGSFPIALLRVTGPTIANLLLPSTGLGPVFQSSAFDLHTMQSKLDEISVVPNLDLLDPLDDLRSSVQMIRTIDLAPESWSSTICRALARATRAYGSGRVAQVILEQIMSPTSMLNGELDVFTAFSTFLLVSRFTVEPSTALRPFVDAALPGLFDADSTLLHAQVPLVNLLLPVTSLARSLKATLLLGAALDQELNKLVDHLIDILLDLQTKASAEENGKKSRREPRPNNQQKAVLFSLMSGLGSDEELRDRWPRFGELVESQS